ncbi:hypothetical protein BJP34_32840 [Moorena producens PAL-8-15-08-1]|uniref:Fluorescence recovery protein n=1 Tax=Moorena producens PAL-8-15-08-1 TaxID=1458985 RepID=A0A1D8U4H7_9CYAN|nr:hypothetical protein [Moorena producens]AOX04664.1 hypothetical protein BJP34_32840 [Moorena producens PAL-8-15-08-1]
MSESNWSECEKKGAQEAFKKAYNREIKTLIEEVKQKGSEISEIDGVWQLHDLLSTRRHDIDGKYDYRYSSLIFVFARLLKEGWLNQEELQFLERDKLAKITALSRM